MVFAYTFQAHWLSYCSCFTLFTGIRDAKASMFVTIFRLPFFIFMCVHIPGHWDGYSRASLV